ncbi:MAG: MoxR family ATPase [Candidatus Dadabacteria bacterium]|nr:MoxR family ATPase [Candidatus Dadabacteria bacterium]NIS08723.1 MoxR family ATPase [Candidatus Dadabacteria bacterium]NIV42607.1 AAA domain-containing protein [Candidatus Dadabacteria bacterium]NIX15409.1 AAA domain-containing protein [Candidatus Dadabacteria bacterium]NIY22072.1 AAA domain-containing protein [Candidatus Dadabacteria bacterium]
MDSSDIAQKVNLLERNIQKVVRGKKEVIRDVIVALLSGGHVLIEDVPGVGKTTLAQSLAKSTNLSYNRIQFTSDLLPSDILGVSIFDQNTTEFKFSPGPVFSSIVLADEINRATPKTQSALLQAMSESKVTVDGKTFKLVQPFIVIATQNPFEYKGTFPLPENQLDRFAIRISIGYPDYESEKEIITNSNPYNSIDKLNPVISKEDILQLQSLVEKVTVDESILEYILNIVNKTRDNELFELGVSPRGTIAFKLAAQANAIVEGRNYCIPDDVKNMAVAVLAHRVIMKTETSKISTEEEAIQEISEQIKVPH